MIKNSTLYNTIYVFCALSPIMLLFCVVGPALSDGSSNLLLQGIESLYQAYNDWDEKMFEQSLTEFEMAAQIGQRDGLAEYWSGTAYFFSLCTIFFQQETPLMKLAGLKMQKKALRF